MRTETGEVSVSHAVQTTTNNLPDEFGNLSQNTTSQGKSYNEIWANEIKARGWDQIFHASPNEHIDPPSGETTIFDITTTDITEWHISYPDEYKAHGDPVPEYWIQTGRARLRAEASGVKLRVIVFNQSTHVLMRELLGVQYDIEPEFFRDIAESCVLVKKRPAPFPHDHRMPAYLVDGLQLHLNFGYGWTAKVILDYAGVIVSAARIEVSPSAAALVDQNRHFNYQIPDIDTVYNSFYADPDVDCAEAYAAAIRNSSPAFREDMLDDSLVSLIPVLEFHKCLMCGELANEDRRLRIGVEREEWRLNSHLAELAWNALRMMKHDAEGPMECFRCYVMFHPRKPTICYPDYLRLRGEFDNVMKQIGRTLDLAKDYFDAQVSWLSLEESRESIKQSRLSIEEGKRTKLVTILAFFFIPMSLSTSVSGMNISELNESGQPLWVFIVTTLAIFVVSSLVWLTLYVHHLYSSLPEGDHWEQRHEYCGVKCDTSKPTAAHNVHWRVRLHLFLELLRHGHFLWAWKSGIAFSLYTGGRKGFIKSCTEHDRTMAVISSRAQDYIDKHILCHLFDNAHYPCAYIVTHLDLKQGFECSKLEYH